jgi:outer membrane protein assembly factor BamB
MTRRTLLLAIAATLAVAACSRSDETAVRAVWRWRPPPVASVGMPGADATSVGITYGHWFLVLLDGAGKQQWRAERLGLRDVAPLLQPDRVVAATDTGMAAFARDTGRALWDVDLGDRANTPVPASGGRLVVTTWDGRLLVLDAASGAVQHAVTLPGPALGPGAASGSTAVASWDDGARAGVVAVDVTSGAVRWHVPVAADGVSGPAVGARNAVVVTGDAHAVAYALDTGRRVWSRPTSGAGSPEAPPVGAVIVADRLGGLIALTMPDGRLRWRVSGAGAAVRGGPAQAGRLVALPVDDGRVLMRHDGQVTVLDPPGRVSGVAAGPGHTVVVATREAQQNELVAYR